MPDAEFTSTAMRGQPPTLIPARWHLYRWIAAVFAIVLLLVLAGVLVLVGPSFVEFLVEYFTDLLRSTGF